ncbi:MAG: hypothetical protein NZ893_01215 [Candidatus Aenigmarchaeota archaeon]|nr:hypothetical protein [Candidatus Aenigmarchaeota archaeon]
MITIGLAATAYFFISNVAERTTSSSFQILEISGNKIIISNYGTQPIMQNDLKVVIDGQMVSATIEGSDRIEPNQVGRVTFSASLSEGFHKIIVMSKGSSYSTSFYYSTAGGGVTTTTVVTTIVTTTTTPTTTTVVTTTTLCLRDGASGCPGIPCCPGLVCQWGICSRRLII